MAYLTIGQLAERLKITAVAIRYYERRGLIKPTCHSESGYRLYSESVIPRFYLILNAKSVGFTLKEIEELLAMLDSNKATSREIRSRTLTRIEKIKEKMHTLRKIQELLEHWASMCDGKMPLKECPILGNLFKEPIKPKE